MSLNTESLGFKKYLSNTSWLALERFFRLGIALLVVVVIARYLGPESFGQLNYAISFVGLFVALTTLGLDSIVVKMLVENETHHNVVLGTAFVLKLLGAVSSILLILIIYPMFGAEESRNLTYLIAFMGIFQSSSVIDFYFQSKVSLKSLVQAQIIQVVILAVVRLWFAYIEADLIWFAFFYLLDAIFLALSRVFVYQLKIGDLFKWSWDFRLAKSLLSFSWPLILSGVVISIYMKIDQIMIQAFLGNQSVGLYAAAVSLGEVPYVIPMLVATSLFPAIINAKSNSQSDYKQKMLLLYTLMFVLAFLVVVPVFLLSDWGIHLLYGSLYDKSSTVLKIHIIGCFFVFWGIILGHWVVAENLQKKAFICHLLGLLSNIVMNMKLIPLYGIAGAAFATIASQFLSNMIFPLLMGKKFRQQISLQIQAIFYLPAYLFKYVKSN